MHFCVRLTSVCVWAWDVLPMGETPAEYVRLDITAYVVHSYISAKLTMGSVGRVEWFIQLLEKKSSAVLALWLHGWGCEVLVKKHGFHLLGFSSYTMQFFKPPSFEDGYPASFILATVFLSLSIGLTRFTASWQALKQASQFWNRQCIIYNMYSTCTVNREIFVLKIFRGKNFRVKKFS